VTQQVELWLPVMMGRHSEDGLAQVAPSPLTLTRYLSPHTRELTLQPEPLVVQEGWLTMSMASAVAL